MPSISEMGKAARAAAKILASASSAQKDAALGAISSALRSRASEIIAANALDYRAAASAGMSQAMLDRLALTEDRIDGIADGVDTIAALSDPVGSLVNMTKRPNGLRILAKRVPIGVIGIIYESRPNVTVDAACLCFKAGNAVILRSGKEAWRTSDKLTSIMREALASAGLPEDAIALVSDTSRQSAADMMRASDSLDLLIPRGGAGLIRAVKENASVPVIETGVGNCHIYVHKTADLNMAADIIYNAKTSRVSVCNAAESLLVDRDIAKEFLPLAKAALDKKNVELRGCPETVSILGSSVKPASEEDYATEFLDYILSIKVVADIDEAIDHINRFSTGHSECIVTSDYFASEKFLERVDSAAVYVNASTRFTDGGEFGMGAEIGISTQKLHVRGPMGLEALTTAKYVIYGEGQIR